jgi:hypothetical protein
VEDDSNLAQGSIIIEQASFTWESDQKQMNILTNQFTTQENLMVTEKLAIKNVTLDVSFLFYRILSFDLQPQNFR